MPSEALWLDAPGATPRVGEAPVPKAEPGEVVVEVRAVALNPVDAMGGLMRRIVLPWLTYPAVMGTDVAGVVVDVGSPASDFRVGDRVAGYAVGVEKSRNEPAEGAFRSHVTLLEQVTTRIPTSLSFEDASVLPLGLTTAAAGLYEADQLALPYPSASAPARDETVVVFGGATSVGMNGVQLARSSGYRVVATASPASAALVKELGASEVVDYHSTDVVQQLARALAGQPLAGTLAVAAGSLRDAIALAGTPGVEGSGRIASAHPTPVTNLRGRLARRRGLTVTAIWGGTPHETPVGPAVWNAFLPGALADASYVAAPPALVVGEGLAAIPAGLARLRQGVHAQKLVVSLGGDRG